MLVSSLILVSSCTSDEGLETGEAATDTTTESGEKDIDVRTDPSDVDGEPKDTERADVVDGGSKPWYPCDSEISPDRCQGHPEWDRYEDRPKWIERGEFLVEHLAFCGDCHGKVGAATAETNYYRPEAPLSGFDEFYRWDFAPDDEERGGLYAPNITPHPTGLGEWTPDEVRDAVFRGLRPTHDDEYPVIHPVMPYWTYANMTERDKNAVLAYLHQLEPIENRIEEQRQPMPDDSSWSVLDELEPTDIDGDGEMEGIGPFDIDQMPATTLGADHEHYEDAERGKYLTTVAGCAFCHTRFQPPDPSWDSDQVLRNYDTILDPDRLLGGERVWDGELVTETYDARLQIVHSQNISGWEGENRSEGVGDWRINSLVETIRTGYGPVPSPTCVPMPAGPEGPYSDIPDQEAREIAWYLKTSEPQEIANSPDCVPPPD